MIKHSFHREEEDELIVIPCLVDDSLVSLALDTGASHTTIDLTSLLLAGYDISNAVGIEKIATGSGVVDAYIFVLDKIESLGVVREKFQVCTYDFFAYHYSAEFEGVLGLDFLKGIKFCIDLDDEEVTIQHKK